MNQEKSVTSAVAPESSDEINSLSLLRYSEIPTGVSGFTIFYPPATNSQHRSILTPLKCLFAKVKEMWAFGS